MAQFCLNMLILLTFSYISLSTQSVFLFLLAQVSNHCCLCEFALSVVLSDENIFIRRQGQCDQMVSSTLAIYNDEYLPNSTINLPK